jgi:ribosome-associated translation inhibitor RaiA
MKIRDRSEMSTLLLLLSNVAMSRSITESEKQEWEALALQKTWDKLRRELRKVMQKVKEDREG